MTKPGRRSSPGWAPRRRTRTTCGYWPPSSGTVSGSRPRRPPEGRSAPSVTAARVERLRRYVAQMTERTPASPAVRRTVQGYVALCEGELSRIAGRSVSRAWASAAAAWQRERHPYPAAYALLQEAEALFGERARNAHAAERLRAAAALARQLGAQPLLEECAALAARARVRLDQDDTTAGSESPVRAAAVVTAVVPGAAVPGAAVPGAAVLRCGSPGCGSAGTGAFPADRRAGPRLPGDKPDTPRDGRAEVAGSRPQQPGDREAAVHQREDRQRARLPHPGEAGRAHPRTGDRVLHAIAMTDHVGICSEYDQCAA